MKEEFTLEKKMLHHLMLHSCDVPLPGLFHGKLGIALVLAEYAKYNKLKSIKKLSDALIEEALDSLCDQMSLDLASGLCGMGWGIEYLLQNGYMRGDSLIICEAIDRKMLAENLLYTDDMSLETGLEGRLHYLLAHMQGTKGKGMPFPASYFAMLNDKLMALLELQVTLTDSMRNLILMFIKMYHSEHWCYEFRLSDFICPAVKPSRYTMGLKNGLAGYIETMYLDKR